MKVDDDEAPPDGLRERKKKKTKAAIVEAALRLFLEKGFEQTTTEEIAAAADVAPRTLFRYFPTKEDIIFLDQEIEDRAIVDAYAHRRAGEDDVEVALRAVRFALGAVPKDRDTVRGIMMLIVQTPSLLAKTLEITMHGEQLIVEGITHRRSTRAEVLRARVFAASFISSIRAAAMHWVEGGMRGELVDLVDDSIAAPFKRAFGDPPKKR